MSAATPPPTNLPEALDTEHERTEWGTDENRYTRQWDDYRVTTTKSTRAKERRDIATLTMYPDGVALIVKSASVSTATEHAMWNNLVRALGGDPTALTTNGRTIVSYCTREASR